MIFALVVATDRKGCIGKDGTLPWRIPADLQYFHELTTTVNDAAKRNAVIMGRNTWESIPSKRRPLMKRLNIVLTTRDGALPGATLASSLAAGLQIAADDPTVEQTFVIGGGRVFQESIAHPACQRIYQTEVAAEVDRCDTYFPTRPAHFREISRSPQQVSNGITICFVVYGA